MRAEVPMSSGVSEGAAREKPQTVANITGAKRRFMRLTRFSSMAFP